MHRIKANIIVLFHTLWHALLLLTLMLSMGLLIACNESPDDNVRPEPAVVKTLDLTVTGSNVQAPYGNVYLFHSPTTSSGQDEVNLDYALGYGDGTTAPLIDVSQPYNPVVHYVKDGLPHTLHPISAYGTRDDGALDNHSSVRYSLMHFDIDRLSTDYGRVQKGSVVLVLIVLNDPQSQSWVARTVQLRRDYLIHISLPDHKDPTYVQSGELNSKWWQVEE